jgi:hypothetical protein
MLAVCRPAAAQATSGPAARHAIAQPPAKAGCYGHAADGWHTIVCGEDPAPALPHLESEFILDFSMPSAKECCASMDYGALGIDFHSIGTETDSIAGPNARSLQLNTNYFKGKNGDLSWVQFGVQSVPGHPDRVCVWNVDLANLAHPLYDPICAYVNRSRDTILAGDDPVVVGYTLAGSSTSGPLIGMVAGVPWLEPVRVAEPYDLGHVQILPVDMISVVIPDTIGLGGSWVQLGGSVLGAANRSQAIFTKTSITTTLSAASCGQGPNPSPCSVPASGLIGEAGFSPRFLRVERAKAII